MLKKHAQKRNYNFEAPEINPIVEVSNETVKKRDKFFLSDYNVLGSAMSALGNGLSSLLTRSEDARVDQRPFLTLLMTVNKFLMRLIGILKREKLLCIQA